MSVRYVPVALAGALVLLCAAGPAYAAWSGSGSGSAAGRGVIMPQGGQPTARAAGSDVTVRWPAALLPGGVAVSGYRLDRYGANGQPVAVAADCAATISATTCTEHSVPAGTWTYTDTPLQASWAGAASPPSAPVVVG